jgi:hypothetical protein
MAGRLAVAVVFGLALGVGPAKARPLDPFVGTWRGTVVEAKARDDLGPSDLDLTITQDGSGFNLSWTGFELSRQGELRRERFTARFAPTGRAGVYAFDDSQVSLLGRLFASPATGNPLHGETLLWGRVEGEQFVVYGLQLVDRGDFELHRVALVRVGDELAMERSIRTGAERITVIEGRLEQAGD